MLDSIYLNLTLENFEIAFSIFFHIYVMWRLHGLTLCLLMNSSFWFSYNKLGIVHHYTYLGVSNYNFQKILYSFV